MDVTSSDFPDRVNTVFGGMRKGEVFTVRKLIDTMGVEHTKTNKNRLRNNLRFKAKTGQVKVLNDKFQRGKVVLYEKL